MSIELPVPAPVLIDCDGIPDAPFAGWTYEKEQLPNLLRGKIDIRQLDRFVTPAQHGGRAKIAVMEEQLKDKLLVPVQVMLWLYRAENQHLIPGSWKRYYRTIFMTKFLGVGGYPVVIYLYWFDGRWRVFNYDLAREFNRDDYIAVLNPPTP